MAAKKGKEAPREFRNAKAGRDYEIGERFEAGVVLRGTEVKSIRGGQVSLADSFCRVERGEVFAYHVHVPEYAFGNQFNHLPTRPRKLLLGRRQIEKVRVALEAEGKSLIPLRLYFKLGLVKMEVALCTGKKEYDKRATVRKREEDLRVRQALKARR